MVIGLTGVFGAGKSTVLEMFRRRGARVLSADAIVRRLLENGTQAGTLRATFGDGFFRSDGTLDRARLAAHVFAVPADRRRLEQILHPAVYREIEAAASAAAGRELLVVEVPLLFESGHRGPWQRVVCVTAPPEKILARLEAKGFTRPDIDRRLAAQLSQAEKARRSDFVISNDGDHRETEHQVAALVAELKQAGA